MNLLHPKARVRGYLVLTDSEMRGLGYLHLTFLQRWALFMRRILKVHLKEQIAHGELIVYLVTQLILR